MFLQVTAYLQLPDSLVQQVDCVVPLQHPDALGKRTHAAAAGLQDNGTGNIQQVWYSYAQHKCLSMMYGIVCSPKLLLWGVCCDVNTVAPASVLQDGVLNGPQDAEPVLGNKRMRLHSKDSLTFKVCVHAVSRTISVHVLSQMG